MERLDNPLSKAEIQEHELVKNIQSKLRNYLKSVTNEHDYF